MIAGLGAQVQAASRVQRIAYFHAGISGFGEIKCSHRERGTARGTFHTSSSREPRAREGRDARAHIVVV